MESSRSPLKTLGMTVMAALAVVGAGALVVMAGAFGTSSKKNDPPVASAQPIADTSGKKASADSISALYAKVKSGVVYVQSTSAQGQDSGSGFVLDTSGNIITNEHVIDGTTDLKVRVGDKGALIPATLVGADASKDLALIKVDPSAVAGGLHPLTLASSSSVGVGDPVIAIGSPFGLQSTLTSGIVSALDRDIQSPNGQTISGAIQTDAAINPGNSGGPLIDQDGQVIGINAQIASQSGGSTGVGFAIPADLVTSSIAELKAGKDVQQSGSTTDGQQQVDPSQDGQQVDPSQGLTDEQLQQLQEQLEQQGGLGQDSQGDPYADPTDPYGDGSQSQQYADPSSVY